MKLKKEKEVQNVTAVIASYALVEVPVRTKIFLQLLMSKTYFT